MSKVLESLLLEYKYWSAKYAASSLGADFQKKAKAMKHLEEEAMKINMSQEDLDKLLKGLITPSAF